MTGVQTCALPIFIVVEFVIRLSMIVSEYAIDCLKFFSEKVGFNVRYCFPVVNSFKEFYFM